MKLTDTQQEIFSERQVRDAISSLLESIIEGHLAKIMTISVSDPMELQVAFAKYQGMKELVSDFKRATKSS